MLFFLTFTISSALLEDPRLEPFDVRSPNQRFQAEVRVVESDPRMARADPRVELEVVELREDGERRRQWSGLYPGREKKSAHFLTDDGSAFVCVEARAQAKTPLVVVVKKGLTLASFDAETLAIDVDPAAQTPESWLEPSPETCRLRTTVEGLNKVHSCDLLGLDGTLRTIDLSSGELSLFLGQGDAESQLEADRVTVEPAVAGDDARGADEVYVNSWTARALIAGGDALEVNLRGYYPTPGWKLLGFELRAATNDPRSWTLIPLAVRGGGVAAQVTRPFEATARVLGLAEGFHRFSVRGRGGPPVLDARSVEVLPLGLSVRLAERDPTRGLVQEIVLYADGRVRTTSADGSRFLLAREDGRSRALDLIPELDARDAGSRTSDPSQRTFDLCWIRDGKPERIVHTESSLAGAAGDLVAVLLDLVEPPAVDARPARYEVDRAASRFLVHTSSSGLFSAFGHEHKIEITRFTADLAADLEALEKSELSISIDASSLVVADQGSAKDAAEIERELRDKVLQVTRYPKIEFKSTRVTAEAANPGVFAVKITGDLALHGKVRSITVPVRIELNDSMLPAKGATLPAKGATLPAKGATLSAKGEFSIRQTDYGIEPTSAAAGTVKVADKLKLTFDLTLRRK